MSTLEKELIETTYVSEWWFLLVGFIGGFVCCHTLFTGKFFIFFG